MADGVQIHINHNGCTAGRDTKKRLYIKKVVGGVVAYCHHCNEAGFARDLSSDGTRLRKFMFGSSTDIPRIEHIKGLFPFTYDIKNPAIVHWLNTYHIVSDSKLVPFYRQMPTGLGMYIKNLHMNNYGYQIRTFGLGPKYTTHIVHPCGEDVSWFRDKGKEAKQLYITEDYTSAYRIWRDTGHPAVALLKTSISPSTIKNIQALDPVMVKVWLDPDEAGKRAATKVAGRLSYVLLGPSVSVLNYNEPKTYSPTELRRLCGS